MDEIRVLLRNELKRYDVEYIRRDDFVEELLEALQPYLKGPKIPIKKLNDLAGWLQ